MPLASPVARRRFRHISASGIFFQGGAAAVDTSTVVAALVDGLTGSALAVGSAAAIARFGWLFPQLFVAYYAQRQERRLAFYVAGAFGRVACLAGLAGWLWLAGQGQGAFAVVVFFSTWTLYAFVSGIVAVPYNDIVARPIPSAYRSRMLALRFFGGGVLALAVASAAHRLLAALTFPANYAAVLLLGAALLLVTATSFISAGEPRAPAPPAMATGFGRFLRGGIETLRRDRRFRLFLSAQWLGGMAAMALPFYILEAKAAAPDVAVLLGAQTAGALLTNPLWGWWSDHRGKQSLLELVAALGALAPLLALTGIAVDLDRYRMALPYLAVIFGLLGAVGNGATIA